ncbi:hypothetical protein VNO77_15294 [Canavalia gladiata]|uniref:Uncharacterized protein n=1 Tax=Canavalia gladiata TaxID=3824 RepID=A0AAN9M459_CANGL
MAGLQQYNFFPTDFFYPRPQPSAPTLETSSGKPTQVPIQTPKQEIKNQKQHPRRMIIVPPPCDALVLAPKMKSLTAKKRYHTLSIKAHSWAVWLGEEEGDAF